MTPSTDFDRMLGAWIEQDAAAPVRAGALDRALEGTRQRRPRPAWVGRVGSDWLSKPSTLAHPAGLFERRGVSPRAALSMTVLVLLALFGAAILIGAWRLRSTVPFPPSIPRLAYAQDDSVFLSDVDGANPVRIAGPGLVVPKDCSAYFEGSPWSPDGRHLAFRSFGSAPCVDAIYIAAPDGRVEASTPGTGWRIPWSPDSTRIATRLDSGQTTGVYGLDGVAQQLVTVPPHCRAGGDHDPVWAQDGMSLVDAGCWIPLDGTKPIPLLSSDPRARSALAAWSPDGSRFARIAGSYLEITRADGTILRTLEGLAGQGYRSPAWSPSGERIAYAWSTGESPDELRITDVATGATSTVVRGDSIGGIQYSSDGTRLLYTISDGNKDDLWSVNVDGTDDRLIASNGHGYWRPPERSP